MTEPFTSLHLFCGSGGDARGYADEGFIVTGIDVDPRALDDFRRLCDRPAHQLDIAAAEPGDLAAVVSRCPDSLVLSAPCLPADGIVLTEIGPRRIDSIVPGERVISHLGRHCRVAKVNSRPYVGNMYGVRLNGTLEPQWYTAEHPIWVRKVIRNKATGRRRELGEARWTPAREVVPGDRVGFPVPRADEGTARVFVRGHAAVEDSRADLSLSAETYSLWTLLGAYIGDGDRRKDGRAVVRFNIGAMNGDAYQLVTSSLEALGLRFSVDATTPTNVRVSTTNAHLWRLCGAFGDGSANKHIPEILFGLEDEWMRALIKGLRAADGSDRPAGWRLTSISMRLLQGVQRLMLRLGAYGSITRVLRAGKAIIEGREVNISDSYALDFYRHPKKSCYRFEDGAVWLRVKRVYERMTSEPVWNLEVDGDDTYCSPLIATHNCKGYSGLMSEDKSQSDHYQNLNSLALKGLLLVLSAWPGRVPKTILFENVPRITSRGKEMLEQITKMLQAHGYAVVQYNHDCGEVGGLAQHRRRFLLRARHMETCPDFIRLPAKQRVRSIAEQLFTLPVPRPEVQGGDTMHVLQRMSAENWARIATPRPGKDWKDIPAVVELVECDSAEAVRVGLRWSECKGRQDGKMGVQDPSEPAHTVIGSAVVTKGWDPSERNGRPDCYGVADADEPSPTIRGLSFVQSSRASVADKRVSAQAPRRRRGETSPIQYDDRGWPIPTHTMVRFPDGRVVLYGPRLDFEDKRGCYLVIASVEVATGRRWWARPLTVRELADLQSFPRDFIFCGPVSSGKTGTGQKERIGNAIPLKAARACAREDRLALEASRDGGFRLAGGPIWVEPEERAQA